jgi:hypothetical protein
VYLPKFSLIAGRSFRSSLSEVFAHRWPKFSLTAGRSFRSPLSETIILPSLRDFPYDIALPEHRLDSGLDGQIRAVAWNEDELVFEQG